jgi:4-hydroxyproline epimerase
LAPLVTPSARRVIVVDSHTEGEPTRVVVAGGPRFEGRTARDRLREFGARHDRFRSSVVNEPRGSDAMVGALLLEPVSTDALAQVLFFNNVGCLQMCVHGTIGVAETLRWLGRAGCGRHRLETPAGDVAFVLHDDGTVSVENVPSFRASKDVAVETRHHGVVVGDVAWGGNWFFLVEDHGQRLDLENRDALTAYTLDVRCALARDGITGSDGGEIDHVELFGPPTREDADSRNFVLCPGLAYDRSPCGTGTSAKMACLFDEGKLAEGDPWRQESIIGSRFVGSIVRRGDLLLPTVRGQAWVTMEGTLVLRGDDPYGEGIRP